MGWSRMASLLLLLLAAFASGSRAEYQIGVGKYLGHLVAATRVRLGCPCACYMESEASNFIH